MHTFKVEKNKVFVGYFDAKSWADAQRMAASDSDDSWMDYNATVLTAKQKTALGLDSVEKDTTEEE